MEMLTGSGRPRRNAGADGHEPARHAGPCTASAWAPRPQGVTPLGAAHTIRRQRLFDVDIKLEIGRSLCEPPWHAQVFVRISLAASLREKSTGSVPRDGYWPIYSEEVTVPEGYSQYYDYYYYYYRGATTRAQQSGTCAL